MTNNEKRLIRRYLVWCYKTVKESLDRIDRYYTQNQVDSFILSKFSAKNSTPAVDPVYRKLVQEFTSYAQAKLDNADKKKYVDKENGRLHPEYQYLLNRFKAIEGAVKHFLGAQELQRMGREYEQEMTSRIWSAKEH